MHPLFSLLTSPSRMRLRFVGVVPDCCGVVIVRPLCGGAAVACYVLFRAGSRTTEHRCWCCCARPAAGWPVLADRSQSQPRLGSGVRHGRALAHCGRRAAPAGEYNWLVAASAGSLARRRTGSPASLEPFSVLPGRRAVGRSPTVFAIVVSLPGRSNGRSCLDADFSVGGRN